MARQQVELCMHYLNLDLCDGARTTNNENANVQTPQNKLDAISHEHGDRM